MITSNYATGKPLHEHVDGVFVIRSHKHQSGHLSYKINHVRVLCTASEYRSLDSIEVGMPHVHCRFKFATVKHTKEGEGWGGGGSKVNFKGAWEVPYLQRTLPEAPQAYLERTGSGLARGAKGETMLTTLIHGLWAKADRESREMPLLFQVFQLSVEQ